MALGDELRNTSSSYCREDELLEIVKREVECVKKEIECQAPYMARTGARSFVLHDDWDHCDAVYIIRLGKASKQEIDYAKKVFSHLISTYAKENDIKISYSESLHKERYSLFEAPHISIHIKPIRISW